MKPAAPGKYALRTLHEEIGLLDRKLAHLRTYEAFANDSERDAAATRMENKRNLLVRHANDMISEGIEFLPSEVPVSLRTGTPEPEAPSAPEPVAAEPVFQPAEPTHTRPPSPFSGTSLDASQEIGLYRAKKKTRSARVAAADRALSKPRAVAQ